MRFLKRSSGLLTAILGAGLLLTSWYFHPPAKTQVVKAADSTKKTILVRFAQDFHKDVDWSGSVEAAGSRVSGWQFDPKTDSISGSSWQCISRQQEYWDSPYERAMKRTTRRDKVTAKGIMLELQSPGAEKVSVKTRQGDFTFDSNLAIGAMPLSFLDGRVQVQAVPATDYVTHAPAAEDYPSLCEAQDGTLWLAYQAYTEGGDQVLVQRLSGGVWSKPEPLAEPNGDYFRTAMAQDRNGRIWVVWSARSGANYDLYARAFDGKRWSTAQRLTTAENSDIFHVMAADAAGNLYLAWQSGRNGNFDIYLRTFNGKSWGPEMQVSSDSANDWEPSLAVSPKGQVAVVWDTYSKGNYDVVMRVLEHGKLGPQIAIAESGALENRVSTRYDSRGRLWVAYNEGDWSWGKDYGYEIGEFGRGLCVRRQVRVAVMENGRLLQTSTVADAVPEDLRQLFHHPTLVLDRNDNPWLLFRVRVNLPVNLPYVEGNESFRALWRTYVTTYREGRWTTATEVPDGYGRIDMASAAALGKDGNLAVVWASDGRTWPNGKPNDQKLHFTAIPSAPPAGPAQLSAFVASAENLPVVHPNEAADVKRIRSYRTNVGGRNLRIVRGDIHRHTDLSWDGNRDGSLDDSYRYAMDAAAFDYLGVCDHQSGQMLRYSWWRLQKAVDLYTIRSHFTPVYSYERSLRWPNGHRNVIFPLRGRPVLEIPPDEENGKIGAKALYEYLRRLGGVATSHTSASGAGTDFRDSDPDLEPIVEIYQGYGQDAGGSQEIAGGPRAPTAQQSTRYKEGFVTNAWAKGIKLGVQSSSDHVSAHISYASFYVDDINRDSIVAAMKARRAFAATDNIFVETRMGNHFMGEIVPGPAQPLQVYVSGTGPLAKVEVIRNNKVVRSMPGEGNELRFTYKDMEPATGETWYYVRAQQQNGQLCWSSPIWVKR